MSHSANINYSRARLNPYSIYNMRTASAHEVSAIAHAALGGMYTFPSHFSPPPFTHRATPLISPPTTIPTPSPSPNASDDQDDEVVILSASINPTPRLHPLPHFVASPPPLAPLIPSLKRNAPLEPEVKPAVKRNAPVDDSPRVQKKAKSTTPEQPAPPPAKEDLLLGLMLATSNAHSALSQTKEKEQKKFIKWLDKLEKAIQRGAPKAIRTICAEMPKRKDYLLSWSDPTFEALLILRESIRTLTSLSTPKNEEQAESEATVRALMVRPLRKYIDSLTLENSKLYVGSARTIVADDEKIHAILEKAQRIDRAFYETKKISVAEYE